jgi:hypothetical protein
MNTKWHGGRYLLNRKGFNSTAAICAEVQDTSSWDDKTGIVGSADDGWVREPNYVFQLSDCSRVVSFELDFSTPQSRKNDIYKIDTMIRALENLRDGVVAEQILFAKREIRRKNEI